MKKAILLAILLVAPASFAEQVTCDGAGPKKICYIPRSRESLAAENRQLKAKIAALQGQLEKQSQKQEVTNVVTVNAAPAACAASAAPRTVTRTVTKTVARDKNPNSVSLLGTYGPTKLVTSSGPAGFSAETQNEADGGIMYQRDWNALRGSAGLTSRGTVLLGIGLNF